MATGAFARSLTRGGAINWLLAAVLMSLAFWFISRPRWSSPPARAAAGVLSRRPLASLRTSRTDARVRPRAEAWHARTSAVWMIPARRAGRQCVLVAAGDLAGRDQGGERLRVRASRRGAASGWARSSAPKRRRMRSDRGGAARALSCSCGAIGFAGLALAGFCAAGIAWGYLAGASRSLDFLQPGRHTYAFYTALAIAGGAVTRRAPASGCASGPRGSDRLDRWAMAGACPDRHPR